MKKRYTGFIMIVAILALFTSNSHSQKTIMFVGRDAISTYASDQDLYDSLKAWGYVLETLDYYTSSEFAALAAGSFDGYDGVFINETVNSSDVTNFGATLNYPLPCVNLEGYAPRVDRWNWLSNNDTEFIQTADGAGTADDQTIVIKDNSHYITEIYNVGDEVVWSGATGVDIAQNEPTNFKEVNVTYSNKLAQNKSQATQTDFWTMVTIDSSANFPNRMFLWGMNHVGIDGEETTTQHYGTQAFFTIIRRACDWAFGVVQSTTSVPGNIYQPDYKLVAFPVPATDQVTVRFNAPNPVNAKVVLYNIIGQRIETLLHKNVVVGNNFIFLNVQKYNPGVYYVGLEIEGNTEFAKIVVN